MAERLSFSYPLEQREALSALAKKDSRSLSSYIQTILTAHIKEKEITMSKSAKDTKTEKPPVKKVRVKKGLKPKT